MALSNKEIADRLDLLADMLEFEGANSFRVRAYRNGTRVIRGLSRPLHELIQEGDDLTQISGIGKSVAEKCQTLVETGLLPDLDALRAKVPESVLEMLRIPGLGPKRAAIIFHELHVKTLADLRQACESGKVRNLKGFGKKTEETILAGMKVAEAVSTRIYWAEADAVVAELRQHLQECAAIQTLEFAGSYRRGKETVGDLDVLVVSRRPDQVMDHFGAFEQAADVLVRGPTKMSIRTRTGLQIDLRVVPQESFGAALQYFTGSKEHNVILRGLAKAQGLKINEYGVYRVQTPKEDVYLAGASEEEVYAALNLPVFPPELREGRGEYELAEAGDLPKLVELDQIVGDLHMHTTETDGLASLREMADAAIARGLRYIAITDHSQRVSMAGGLDPKRLRKQWREIERLNQELGERLLILKGIECDILEKGGMDLPDDVLAEADWVLASIHYGQSQPREQLTERILGAVEHPNVSAIAHPTGRLINRREAYPVDMDQVIRAAAKHQKRLELNANPARLDLNELHCAAAAKQGVPIVVSTDAHSVPGLDVMRFGVLQARRGGLTAAQVANTAPWPWT